MDGLIAYALAKKYTDKVGQDIISAGFKVQVEEDRSILNRQGEEKVLYLLPKEYGSDQDGYDEFVYANRNWEWVGKTDVSFDYESLENKPQINGVELTGNKTASDLNLQGKLTAGNNITINNGVISASGGVTDYNELENKPQINGYTLSGDKTASDLKLQKQLRYIAYDINSIAVDNSFDLDKNVYLGKEIFLKSKNNAFDLGVQPHVFRDYTGHMGALLAYRYDFNIINSAFAYCGGFSFTKNNLTNSPTFISDLKIDRIRIYHFFSPASAVEESKPLLRYVVGTDSTSNGVRIFAQIAQAVLQQNQSYSISYPSDWVELTGGGAQIVSGVVNADGTITFTDSEGNSFTTSGESVIGPQGDDYVLTAQDKNDIADIVLSELPTTEGVLYGNQSN